MSLKDFQTSLLAKYLVCIKYQVLQSSTSPTQVPYTGIRVRAVGLLYMYSYVRCTGTSTPVARTKAGRAPARLRTTESSSNNIYPDETYLNHALQSPLMAVFELPVYLSSSSSSSLSSSSCSPCQHCSKQRLVRLAQPEIKR